MSEFKKDLESSIPLAESVLLIKEISSLRNRVSKTIKQAVELEGVGRNLVIENSIKNHFIDLFCKYFEREYYKFKEQYEFYAAQQEITDQDFIKIFNKDFNICESELKNFSSMELDAIANSLGKALALFFVIVHIIVSLRLFEDIGIKNFFVNCLSVLLEDVNFRVRVKVEFPSESVWTNFDTLKRRIITLHELDSNPSSKWILEYIIEDLEKLISRRRNR